MEDLDAHPTRNTSNKMTEENLNPLPKLASMKKLSKNIKEGFLKIKIIRNLLYSFGFFY
jgi:hypothetical protein